MEQKTIDCPACGAPLEVSDQLEALRCGYCDADLKIIRVDDKVTFEVLSQPEPQKEVLDRPVIPVEPSVFDQPAAVYDLPPVEQPAFFTEPQRSEPFTPEPSIPVPPPFTGPTPGAQVYQPAAPAKTGAPTWLWIVLGIVGVVCLFCACLAVLAVFFFNVSGVPVY